jgi:DNA-binding response OmpR family regulator
MRQKILLVDDDPAIRKLLSKFLTSHQFTVVEASDGAEGLRLAQTSNPDVVLTDAAMPELDGHTLIQILRKDAPTRWIPLILMSGKKIEENEILAGFEQGADDYIVKPFSLPVLLARIQATLRRYDNLAQNGETLKKIGLDLDPMGRTVKVDNKPIQLTRKEFDLLTLLINKSGRVLSHAYLLETIWGYDPAEYNDPATIETHSSHLRKKLGPLIAKRIVNYTGNGYKFDSV